jgi:hypothetical protein
MWRPVHSKPGPGCLHSHSAVKFLNAMILFSGELEYGLCKDHFSLCSVSRMWRPVRSKPSPGCLHSHSAVKFLNAMILFGGELEYGLYKDNFPMFSFPDVAAGAQQAGPWLPPLPLSGQVPQRHDPIRRRAGGTDTQRALEVPLR